MNKVVKKSLKKNSRKLKMELCFVILFMVYLCSCIIVKNYNISLDHQLNTLTKENQNIKQNNQTLKLKIDDLSSFERMNSVAKENGLENREGTIKNVR
ncbi:hypothetical protein [Mycoplasma sp. P36-A1]|uniref:hypothetical protein n=1 Tax=Mycoplasma sp. P36-A1 TaxID=3252900 RepID=UPI003C2D1220